ncbi:hypothetical protein [Schleiferilactobacillus harbinensis]|uniref:hypothetical protein n=1 Tax=Schleiferilactobacillus harbinensis TaxID=304207 RepID=UPI001173925F|nr:hypothetical protein [Schleiferilactobacillus harbinensis]GEK06430.1 hypothetical protein LHA01_16690 [Schleiferilactobacillus harbinensis]
MDICIPLFRVDEKAANRALVAGHMVPASTEDGDWAGAGLYFWDNLGNAQFWLRSKRGTKSSYSIAKATLTVSEMEVLDLTEPNSVKKFERVVVLLRDKLGTDFEGVYSIHQGAVINAVYQIRQSIANEAIIQQLPNFSVVKVIGYYPNAPELFSFRSTIGKKKQPHVTIKAKPIYSVLDQQLLQSPMIIEGDGLL